MQGDSKLCMETQAFWVFFFEGCRKAFCSRHETQSCREMTPAVQHGEVATGQWAASMRTEFQYAGEVKQHMFNLLLLPGS